MGLMSDESFGIVIEVVPEECATNVRDPGSLFNT